MPTLPYANKEDVKVFGNEYINVNTINRALLRLYYNDSYLAGLSSLNAVDSPTVANMLLVSTGPAAYTWKTTAQAKTLLNITDSVFGLSDVDEVASNMLQGYTLSWDATKKAFVGAAAATELDDLDDVTITTPANLHSLLYSSEYGKFINGYLSDFTVGYVTHVTLEDDGKVILPEVTTIGQQIVITKIGIGTSVYIIPDSTNKINGQTNKVLKTYNTGEIVSTIHLRSVIRDDASIEWVIISSEGTFTYIDSSLVPGSSILIRTITNNDLMLAPYSVTLTDVPDASSITKGIVRLATEVEAQAGTLTTVAVTPYGVKYWFDNYAVPFATDLQFSAGSSTDTVVTPAQIHKMDTEYIALTSHDTYDLTYSNETTTDYTWTYAIDEFNGTGLNTSEIRMIYIESQVYSGSKMPVKNEITATMPDGTPVSISYAESTYTGDTISSKNLSSIPINKGQVSITIAIGSPHVAAGIRKFTIVGVSQRVFDN